jgi:hypothetical protein
MKQLVLTLFCIYSFSSAVSAVENQSKTYDVLIRSYQDLQKNFPQHAKLVKGGLTDSGINLSLFILSDSGQFDPSVLKNKKLILFILNGIHPGEPDGMDASLEFATELLNDKSRHSLLRNVAVCIVPVYNIEGALIRSCCSRANQNGPEEYGFRGNAKNLDLNRDFMKLDSKNSVALVELLRRWNPDVFIDTHVSNGADYQYTLTLISSQHDKMNPVLGTYMKNTFTPSLFNDLKTRKCESTPYVDTYHSSGLPDSGLVSFFETPRFSSGYQALFNCFSFITETHMLKPFDQRVEATKTFLETMIDFCYAKKSEIKQLRNRAWMADRNIKFYPIAYELDISTSEKINFKGYGAKYSKSAVTGLQRLSYDHNSPYEKQIPFYDHYHPVDSIEVPQYYVIPQAWNEVIERLEKNHVKMFRLKNDSVFQSRSYYLDNFETLNEPFEGHYLHSGVRTKLIDQKKKFLKGDYLIPVRQENMRYIIEVLEPKGSDSFFSWGFFDAVLQQKEWFSPYVFEDIAADLLMKDSTLNADFQTYKKENAASGSFDQLYFIYQRSPYFEKETYRMYPVGRIF